MLGIAHLIKAMHTGLHTSKFVSSTFTNEGHLPLSEVSIDKETLYNQKYRKGYDNRKVGRDIDIHIIFIHEALSIPRRRNRLPTDGTT